MRAKHVNRAGIAYGEWMDYAELPAAVRQAIDEAVIEDGLDSGEVAVGGERYRWEKETGNPGFYVHFTPKGYKPKL